MFFEEKELKEKLDRDFRLLKMKLTNEEAKKFVDGKLNVICFYEVFNWIDSHEISGGVFMYKIISLSSAVVLSLSLVLR